MPARIDGGYLLRVRAVMARALDYQHIQYDDVLDWTDPGLYDVKVTGGRNQGSGGLAALDLGEATVRKADEPEPVRLSRRPLSVTLTGKDEEDLAVVIEYRTEGLDEAFARTVLAGMLDALAELAAGYPA
ncbi:MAG: hypothetical protein M3Z75_29680 [Actinomycetota bacterium]|nr:hypothetical protein [Actinomycetota bacterium]